MKPCVTISLVEEARGGPFVYWHDPLTNARRAQSLGFPAIEIFPPDADALSPSKLPDIPSETGQSVAAIGSGGGWVRNRWHLTHPSAEIRQKALDFIRRLLDAAARFHAPVIIGSMQGKHGDGVSLDQALGWLGEALTLLGQHAKSLGTGVYYEPLNRYESNLMNTAQSATDFLDKLKAPRVQVLADLFHMNIEESNVAEGLLTYGNLLGHVHLVDNHRQAAGSGQMDYSEVAAALKSMGFAGHLSAEVFPIPDSHEAARRTMDTYQRWFAGSAH